MCTESSISNSNIQIYLYILEEGTHYTVQYTFIYNTTSICYNIKVYINKLDFKESH